MTRHFALLAVLLALAFGATPQQTPPPQPEDLAKQVQGLAKRLEALEKQLPVAGAAPSSAALTAVDTRIYRIETRLDRLEAHGSAPFNGSLSSGEILRLESRLSSLESQVARLSNR
jgi:hypothetical protein